MSVCLQGFHKLSQAKSVWNASGVALAATFYTCCSSTCVQTSLCNTTHYTTRHVAPLPMLCIRLYSQYVVVSTYCIKFTSFAYVRVPKASKQVRTGVTKKKQDEENEGMKKIELWRHEIICMNNLPSHTGQLNVMVIYNYTIISLLVIYTTLSNCLRRNDLQIPVQLLTTTTCASGMVPPVQR